MYRSRAKYLGWQSIRWHPSHRAFHLGTPIPQIPIHQPNAQFSPVQTILTTTSSLQLFLITHSSPSLTLHIPPFPISNSAFPSLSFARPLTIKHIFSLELQSSRGWNINVRDDFSSITWNVTLEIRIPAGREET